MCSAVGLSRTAVGRVLLLVYQKKSCRTCSAVGLSVGLSERAVGRVLLLVYQKEL